MLRLSVLDSPFLSREQNDEPHSHDGPDGRLDGRWLGLLVPPAQAQVPTGPTPAPAPRTSTGSARAVTATTTIRPPRRPRSIAVASTRPPHPSRPRQRLLPQSLRTTRLSSSLRPVADPTGRDVPLYKPWLQPLR